jgi:predicted ABC-type ATPase
MAQWMWIIAGPNGAGKSSFAGRFLRDLGHRHLIKLNADERTLELRPKIPGCPAERAQFAGRDRGRPGC